MEVFQAALRKACGSYLLHGRQPKIVYSSKSDATDLHTALKRVRKLLKAPGMSLRLMSGLVMAIDRPSKREIIEPSLRLAALEASVENLIAAAKCAATIDGRRHKYPKRIELHCAAMDLWVFWTTELGRAQSVQNRGGLHTKALDFLLDCLRCLDPKVKEASILGF